MLNISVLIYLVTAVHEFYHLTLQSWAFTANYTLYELTHQEIGTQQRGIIRTPTKMKNLFSPWILFCNDRFLLFVDFLLSLSVCFFLEF